MIISDRFVFLHPPKTGGTFVREALTKIYAGEFGQAIFSGEKHAAAEAIPPEHLSKELVTLVRNPFDYYASHYRFGYWIHRREEPWVSLWDEEPMRERFSSYPYLEFQEFLEGALELGHRHLEEKDRALAEKLGLGPLTVRMLQFSVPNYLQLLDRLSVDHDTGPLKCALARSRFLHTESLNRDTYRWLVELGVPPALAEPILLQPAIQPRNTPDGAVLEKGHGQPRQEHWSELFDRRAIVAVLDREWLFFELFPEYAWDLSPSRASAVQPPGIGPAAVGERMEHAADAGTLCRLVDARRSAEQRLRQFEQESALEVKKRDDLMEVHVKQFAEAERRITSLVLESERLLDALKREEKRSQGRDRVLNEQINEQQLMMESEEHQIHDQEQQIQELGLRIQELHASWSWRLTAPLRVLGRIRRT